MSVGVARQYNGRLGKIDNCQVGVFAALSDRVHSGLISRLSPHDIVAALTLLIPYKDTTIEEALGIIQRRHKNGNLREIVGVDYR